MPLIEPENKKKPQKLSVCLTHEVFEELERYCQFLDSSSDHVIGALIHTTIPRDRDYAAWKAEGHELPASAVTHHIKTENRGRKKIAEAKSSPQAISAVPKPISA